MGIASIAKGLSAMSAAKSIIGGGGDGGEQRPKNGVGPALQEMGKSLGNAVASVANSSFTNIDDRLNGTTPPQPNTGPEDGGGGFNINLGTSRPSVDEDPTTPETTILDDD